MDVSNWWYFQNLIYLGKTRIQLCHNEVQDFVQLMHTNEKRKKATCDSSSWEPEAEGSLWVEDQPVLHSESRSAWAAE